jgi:hypothetical protein
MLANKVIAFPLLKLADGIIGHSWHDVYPLRLFNETNYKWRCRRHLCSRSVRHATGTVFSADHLIISRSARTAGCSVRLVMT